jgi:hypothetical protein
VRKLEVATRHRFPEPLREFVQGRWQDTRVLHCAPHRHPIPHGAACARCVWCRFHGHLRGVQVVRGSLSRVLGEP